jgi:hypothetical protein
VDIFIDNVYNNTVPISAEQTTFNTSVQLTAGTHTIRADATDVCANNNASDSVVVTYEPAQTPPPTGGGSTGADVPTEIPNAGVFTGGNPLAPSATPFQFLQLFGNGVPQKIADLLEVTDLYQPNSPAPWANVVRVSLIVVGSVALIFGAPWLTQRLFGVGAAGVLAMGSLGRERNKDLFLQSLIRISGLVLIVMAFLVWP